MSLTMFMTLSEGGPHLERMAAAGDVKAHELPKPMSKSKDRALREGRDYSFAGLKSAVRQKIERELAPEQTAVMSPELLQQKRADLAACFQKTAVDHLSQRVGRAIDRALELEPTVKHMLVAGGVAANKMVRAQLEEVAKSKSLTMSCPPIKLCMDNGVMVSWLGESSLL